MPEPYNMTEIGAASDIGEYMRLINEGTGSIIFAGMLIALCLILTIVLLRKSPPPEAFMGASFITMLASIALWGGGMVPLLFPIGFSSLAGLAAMGLYITNKT